MVMGMDHLGRVENYKLADARRALGKSQPMIILPRAKHAPGDDQNHQCNEQFFMAVQA